ncbi:unnamed protein product [Heligmosomoides polygyrus]|uniref:Uncharacterized protein n=1 Tax=Heligmosomoides polygyrus TaxID=6339 RepID=A0A183G374_HELPZ|nr:unnamed protein product [Heligmosomoides polygyrus]
METEMLRWTAGDTRLDRVRNNTIRRSSVALRYPTSCAKLVFDGIVAAVHPYQVFDRENWRHHTRRANPAAKRETKMLRWTAGVTRVDRIRNDVIRQKFGVAPIDDNMREARLRWYDHVLRGKEDSVRKIGLNFEVIGKRKQRWSDTLHMVLKVAGVHPDLALNRERCRRDYIE